jgi:hypothetical protein
MTKDEIIKALRDMAKYPTVTLPRDCEALKAAANLLAQPDALEAKDEPVAWMNAHDVGFKKSEFGNTPTIPLYTTPPQRTWVGLTDIDYAGLPLEQVGLVRWAEAKLKEKNT